MSSQFHRADSFVSALEIILAEGRRLWKGGPTRGVTKKKPAPFERGGQVWEETPQEAGLHRRASKLDRCTADQGGAKLAPSQRPWGQISPTRPIRPENGQPEPILRRAASIRPQPKMRDRPIEGFLTSPRTPIIGSAPGAAQPVLRGVSRHFR